ncbi:zinc finger protein 707 isoform X3 [Gorilla gorilla gorilla]|uniref:zinc finger protein 707 isoform X3 n=1 Tax=Gorilla gorilla gorilla TaxID=9595 RepID=UPI0024460F08|nr:zinc finger protein 707 isoform X2 [Gorilla gorilla gorilla]XP_055204427.1 zinc finger protein 707 isoform X2 [Gorilla gorilla gorilla]
MEQLCEHEPWEVPRCVEPPAGGSHGSEAEWLRIMWSYPSSRRHPGTTSTRMSGACWRGQGERTFSWPSCFCWLAGARKSADPKRHCDHPAWASKKTHVRRERAREGSSFRKGFRLDTDDGQLPRAAPERTDAKPTAFPCQMLTQCCGRRPGRRERRKQRAVELSFICGTCGKALSCHSRLLAHQTVHTGTKAFECPECGQTFRWASNLQRHQKNHTREKPFCCEACGQAFSLKDRLAQHRKVHTEHRPYSCGDCGKAFRQKSNLLRHQLVHTGERPFYCADCGKAFRTKENLSHHQRVHSGEKPYTCAECGKSFRWPKGFSIHRRLHLTKRFYECGHCGKGFRHLGFFTRHQRTHRHGEV